MMYEDDDISLHKVGRCGVVTLKRIEALNAVTLNMSQQIELFYKDCIADPHTYGIVQQSAGGKAFCAGGDVLGIYQMRNDGEDPSSYFRTEYQHNWTLELFNKPTISLIDGLVMGGGVGISLYGTHRIAGENFKLAMPETGIGFFPDIGGSYFLSRMPDEIGMYLGLTGRFIGPQDAYNLNLVTHCIANAHFETIRKAMIESDPIDPILEDLHEYRGLGEIEQLRPWIRRIFSASTIEEVLESLEKETGESEAWASKTLDILEQKSPTSLKVTFRLIRNGSKFSSLKEALITEFQLASHFLKKDDFYEGVRAALIDKDYNPKWSPDSLVEVTDEMVDSYFQPPENELNLEDVVPEAL